jgi:hypothetical protein
MLSISTTFQPGFSALFVAMQAPPPTGLSGRWVWESTPSGSRQSLDVDGIEIPANKISCLACRVGKVRPSDAKHKTLASPFEVNALLIEVSQRRCDTVDTRTICRRCAVQGLTCEYKRHNRGFKRKEAPALEADVSSHPPSLGRSSNTALRTVASSEVDTSGLDAKEPPFARTTAGSTQGDFRFSEISWPPVLE